MRGCVTATAYTCAAPSALRPSRVYERAACAAAGATLPLLARRLSVNCPSLSPPIPPSPFLPGIVTLDPDLLRRQVLLLRRQVLHLRLRLRASKFSNRWRGTGTRRPTWTAGRASTSCARPMPHAPHPSPPSNPCIVCLPPSAVPCSAQRLPTDPASDVQCVAHPRVIQGEVHGQEQAAAAW